MFVLIMQFLWKYIDDLIGKGLDILIIFKLIFYLSATLIPLALPLAILLSSIMTFGSLGEHYELTAIKASGISLFRFMRPLTIFISVISVFAFYLSNNVIPGANLKFGSLLHDIRRQKPTLSIKEDIFNEDIEGLSIKVGKKDEDGQTLYDLIIYDHLSGNGNNNVILAKKGKMQQTKDGNILILYLQDGVQYKEDLTQTIDRKPVLYVSKFDKWEKHFDLSQFALQRTNEVLFKDISHMLNINQLQEKMDTMRSQIRYRAGNMQDNLKPYVLFSEFRTDSVEKLGWKLTPDVKSGSNETVYQQLKTLPGDQFSSVIDMAISRARTVKSYTTQTGRDITNMRNDLNEYKVEYHKKFKLSFICLVFFFIGAPLGAIIRKGGLGWPIFFSILIFILFYAINMTGERLAEDALYQVFVFSWLSVLVLTPVAFFLSILSNNDSPLFSSDTYARLFHRFYMPKELKQVRKKKYA